MIICSSLFWLENIFCQDTIAVIVMILVFALIIWYITNDSETNFSIKDIGYAFKRKNNNSYKKY